MLNGIRKVLDAERLAARVAELEAENKRLKAEASRAMAQTNFRAVAREFRLDAKLRDIVVEHVIHDLSPIVERSFVDLMKNAQHEITRMSPHRPQSSVVAMADYRDHQFEITIPTLTCGVRVGRLV